MVACRAAESEPARNGQVIVLLTTEDKALSSPSLVYEVIAKYHVPAPRPVTTYCSAPGFEISTCWDKLLEFVP